MPLSIPAFDQYQSPLVPLRGLWNAKPREGDRLVNAEIDWLVTTKSAAVQFSLSGNSAVSLSQIVALYVDNARSGADVDFIFPDSGFVLTVPAHNQGLFPVLTNALMFYASAPGAAAGDTTVLQILNSLPPPIPIVASAAQNHLGAIGVSLASPSTTQLVAIGVNGSLNGLNITVTPVSGASGGNANILLADGSGRQLWATNIELPASVTQTITLVSLSNLNLRFVNGIQMIIGPTSFTGGFVVPNLYFSTP